MPKRYILALVIIAVIFFGGIALIISLLTSDNPSSNDKKTETQTTVQQQKPKDLSTDASQVVYTTYGRVVGEEDRRAIRITITPSERKIEILRGYTEEVIQTQTTVNTTPAFQALTTALEAAGFSSINREVKTDEKAACVNGVRYAYDIVYSSGEKHHSWSTTCGTRDGNFTGNRGLVTTLFKNQIPNYSKITSGVRL